MAKQSITVPKKLLGESYEAYNKRIAAWTRGEDVRSKVDLRDYKTCDFHMAPEREACSDKNGDRT